MQTVIGAFDDATAAHRAVERLVQAGFDRDDIHVQQPEGEQPSQQSQASQAPGERPHQMVNGVQDDLVHVSNTWDGPRQAKPAERGTFFARLFGIDDQVDNRQESPHAEHAHTYDEAVRRGSTVVVVDAQDEAQADSASGVLHECGAIDVDERSRQWRAQGWQPPAAPERAPATENAAAPRHAAEAKPAVAATPAATAPTAPAAVPVQAVAQLAVPAAVQAPAAAQPTASQGTPTVATADPQPETFQVLEEELQVGKRSVDRGGVRVVQRLSQKPVRELVRLREEHATVDRHPVDRPADAQDLGTFQEGTLELHEKVEEPVVAKTARVVEEVNVRKEVSEREQVIEDTLRRTDVDIERFQEPARGTQERERAVASDTDRRVPREDKPTS
jgi:stress response protein YsnF